MTRSVFSTTSPTGCPWRSRSLSTRDISCTLCRITVPAGSSGNWYSTAPTHPLGSRGATRLRKGFSRYRKPARRGAWACPCIAFMPGYGYRKSHDDLRELGVSCGRNRVARLMRQEGLRSQAGRRGTRMMREPSSVRLIWSFSTATSGGGSGRLAARLLAVRAARLASFPWKAA